ncbi:Uncharacterised protein [Mycobacteroides abscessus subsp. abscessus]|uniref:hypothetical protein n=1 Tax=Mycobacteroides abscessus TaxID=36809 RepID=UPI00092C5DA7|nr:hypothetical protein [Mycobacteroides abscessus]SIM03939.1 Uncharacterised protein [Mycobacteroides abscessus subsp. abscessus]SLC78104.1 Uncharacterised protein [Mycobacteroides abscessus subsp. abscessus]
MAAVKRAVQANNRLKSSHVTAADKRAKRAAQDRRKAEQEAVDDQYMWEAIEKARAVGAEEFEAELERIRVLGEKVRAQIAAETTAKLSRYRPGS